MTLYRSCKPEVIKFGTRSVGFRCSCGAYEPVLFLLNNRQRPAAIKQMIKRHLAEAVQLD